MTKKNNGNLLFLICVPIFLLILTACGGDATNTPVPISPTTTAATTAPVITTTAPTTALITAAPTTAVPGTTAATTPGVSSGLTMKEAYTAAESQIKAWQPDQVLFAIFNSLDSGIGINPDGRSAEWNFQAVSVKTGKRGTWLVKAGKDGKPAVTKTGDEELSPAEAKDSPALPPVSQLIDSSRLMEVARQNGGDKSDNPVGFFLRQPIKVGDPLAADLIYYKGGNVLRLRIDMQTGKLVPNVQG